MMDRGQVLAAQAERTLAEIGQLQVALDAGELTVVGSMGQPVANRLLGELRQHRLLLLRLVGGSVADAGGLAEDELDDIRREWESRGP